MTTKVAKISQTKSYHELQMCNQPQKRTKNGPNIQTYSDIFRSLRKFFQYVQEAMPVRMRAIHVLNTEPVLDKLMMLIRPFMDKKFFDMVSFYFVFNLASLFSCYPKLFVVGAACLLPYFYNTRHLSCCHVTSYLAISSVTLSMNRSLLCLYSYSNPTSNPTLIVKTFLTIIFLFPPYFMPAVALLLFQDLTFKVINYRKEVLYCNALYLTEQ